MDSPNGCPYFFLLVKLNYKQEIIGETVCLICNLTAKQQFTAVKTNIGGYGVSP